jgi:hypothetical protein
VTIYVNTVRVNFEALEQNPVEHLYVRYLTCMASY